MPVCLINTALVYANPTVRSLATALRALGHEVDSEENAEKFAKEVDAMVDKYTADLPAPSSPSLDSTYHKDEFYVVLTGSTGSLGSYLLDLLLSDSRVKRVFALNRSADGEAKQVKSSTTRGLSPEWGSRVQFLRADLSQAQLGLSPAEYETLVGATTHIIHNQWPVNFNLPLRTFEPHVQGVRRLVDLAVAAPHRPRVLFTSSISAVGNWVAVHPGVPVPEATIADARVPSTMGYGGSKHAGERILSEAAARSGIDAAVVRVGQLAGSVVRGSVWNRDEWFSSLVISSSFLGVLPASLGAVGDIEFVPIDTAAAILLDVALAKPEHPAAAQVYGLVNPTPVAWPKLLPALVNAIRPSPKVVEPEEWLRVLVESAKDAKDIDLKAVQPKWMEAWAHGWGLDA